ncbi:SLC13 family permease [Nostocoides japonicum]|uniref:SLC13 family permease n=1 Tax=Nostocoides japonicum TaxID=99481 RepID=UPI00065B5A7A|nr:SLC13 family permease [Tetrasphaera japonica]
MSFVQVLSLALLVLVLVLAIWQKLNIGMVALAAALPILMISGFDVDKMYDAFPGNLFVLIAGVSLLFAHVERSGALAVVVKGTYAAVGDRHWLLPWAGFVLAAAMSTAGAFSTAPIAFLVPMIAYVSVGYSSIFYMCELGVVIGANSAGLSPLNPTGAVIRTIADKYHVSYPGWALWAASMVVAIIVVFVLQMISVVQARRGRAYVVTPAPAEQTHDPDEGKNHAYMWASGLALIAFVLLVIFPKTDVGVTAMAMAVLLQIFFRPNEKVLLSRIPWNSILLLCGLLTYLGLMKDIGTMTSIQKALDHLGTGALLIIVLSYMTVLLCNIESSTLGVLGLMMPLVFATFGTGTQTFWIVVAVAVPAALMVMSPIHVAGTLIIGNSALKDQDRLFRRLLATAASLAVVVPAFVVLVPISIG